MNIEEMKKRVGFCKVPERNKVPMLCVGAEKFVPPLVVDLRGYETKTEDQGQYPHCAAYTASQFAENIKWRVNGYPKDIDPVPLYNYAKSIDGDPHGDGTTLDAVCEALRHFGYFDPDKCKTRLIWEGSGARDDVKLAVHRYGCALGAFNISEEFYYKNARDCIIKDSKAPLVGGHAMEIAGYNLTGVILHNSWGLDWGMDGFGIITWEEFDRQFIYAAVLTNALDGLK